MGEIANDMVEGICCCLCGQYFENPEKPDYDYEHGYPVVCWDCWDDLRLEEKDIHERAKVNTL